MRFYVLLVGALVVFRVTHLLAKEDGPWQLVVRLRRRAGIGFWGELLDCFYCLSLWVAAPAAWLAGHDWRERLVLWPALSGAAILLERATAKEPARNAAPPDPTQYSAVQYYEAQTEEERDVMLRSETPADQPGPGGSRP